MQEVFAPGSEQPEFYEAKPLEDGHYGDEDITHHFDSKLEPKSEADVLLHLKTCETCKKRAEKLINELWANIRESHKGFG